jgi:hypothetical protein
VLPRWGDWPIGRIEHPDVQAWVTRLSRRLAPETVASCHGLPSSILATAVRSRKPGASPCDGVRLPPRCRTADAGVTITREQLLGQVLPALPRRDRAVVATAARRTVPLPDFVTEALAGHLAAFPAELDEPAFRNERGGPRAECARRLFAARRSGRPAATADRRR